MNDQSIQRKVGRHLGSPVRDIEWKYLIEQEYVSELLDGANTVEVLADVVRDKFRKPQARRTPGRRAAALGEPQPSRRERTLAEVLAAEARQIEEVQAYRETVVSQDGTGRDLLAWDEALAWLEERKPDERPIGVWLTGAFVPVDARDFILEALAEEYDTFPHDANGELQPLPVTVTIDPTHIGEYLVVRQLRCLVRAPDTGRVFVYRTMTREDGELEWLRSIGAQLAERFKWKESEAVRFVLTDIVPRVRSATAQARVNPDDPTSTRIMLSIDPALSPREVADVYRRARQRLLGARHRELTEKHAQLAVFAAARPAGEKWAQCMSRWNAQHPEWRYHQLTNFARDCTQALRRVLRPTYTPPPVDDVTTPHQ